MKYVLLEPTTETAQLLPQNIFDDYTPADFQGKTIIEVDDEFSWSTHKVEWTTLTLCPCLDHFWENLRYERNRRLSACDWTQLLDQAEEVKLAWQPYRQALRDLPENTIDPREPVWPTPPA